MELEQLRMLAAIDTEGTISRAALSLDTSQPAVSRAIKKLENELGQPLFERTRNRVSFNEAGRMALAHAREMLACEQRMRDAFDELSRKQRTLRVCSAAPAPTWKLAKLVAQRFPGVILQSELNNESAVERTLLNSECDLAITARPMPLPNMRSVLFMTEDLSISAPPDHPIVQRPSVAFDDVDGETFLVLEQVGFWNDIVRQCLPNSLFIPQKDSVVFTQLLQSSNLLGFSSDVEENTRMIGERAAVPLTDAEAHVTYYLCTREDAARQARNILEIAREVKTQLR